MILSKYSKIHALFSGSVPIFSNYLFIFLYIFFIIASLFCKSVISGNTRRAHACQWPLNLRYIVCCRPKDKNWLKNDLLVKHLMNVTTTNNSFIISNSTKDFVVFIIKFQKLHFKLLFYG